jgi:hypothetical protein
VSTFDGEEEMTTISLDPSVVINIKSTETEPPHREVKGECLFSCDAIISRCRQSSLEFIIESMHVMKVDNYVGFYEFFILWGGDTSGKY